MMYVLFFFVFILIMNKAMLRVRVNSQNEDIKREINKIVIRNRKLDELYGRKPTSEREEIERAILEMAKNKNKII
tara:strand:+ start:3169 stop:3393 length:225 start_codon:yes stop_codon:yes gene_type:complete